MTDTKSPVPIERIETAILLIRGQKTMLDKDLASLYGMKTSALNQAVTRNLQRFPDDFMFRLTRQEVTNLKSHFVTSTWGGTRKPPRAFTEQGVAMPFSVLRSERAIQVNIQIMRTFVELRRMLASHEELARKLTALEKKYDSRFRAVFDAIRELMAPPKTKGRLIGFEREK